MFLGRGSHNTLRISRGPQKGGGTDLLNSGCVDWLVTVLLVY